MLTGKAKYLKKYMLILWEVNLGELKMKIFIMYMYGLEKI